MAASSKHKWFFSVIEIDQLLIEWKMFRKEKKEKRNFVQGNYAAAILLCECDKQMNIF